MGRRHGLIAVALALLLAWAPAAALARAGGGASMGSRGTRTFSAPPSTTTAPSYTAPLQRSLTPPPAASGAPFGGGASPGGALAGRSPFMTGLMGGLIGAGIGGLLFGGGLFSGISGFGGFLGLLLQILLVVLIGRWLLRRLFGAGPPAMARAATGPIPRQDPGRAGRPVAIGAADYAAFEHVLKAVQAAWTAHDLAAMRRLTTPEMTSYFAEQLAEQTSRGVRNVVEDVQLLQGDLAEAWGEAGREYATVAMRFAMTDVTYDQAGRVVDGTPRERIEVTEAWTFLRAPGGDWVLSAIQQAG
jgi:predicted lipid-binding transport protein (Tim44 family)